MAQPVNKPPLKRDCIYHDTEFAGRRLLRISLRNINRLLQSSYATFDEIPEKQRDLLQRRFWKYCRIAHPNVEMPDKSALAECLEIE